MAINSKSEFVEYHATLYKMVNESLEFEYDHIQICNPYTTGIHVYTGIRKLADAVGAPLEKVERYDDQYNVRYFFNYKGVEFFQIEQEDVNV